MLMRKVGLTPAARKHFSLFRDPFGEVDDTSGVFTTPDIKYVREAMFSPPATAASSRWSASPAAANPRCAGDLVDRIARERPADPGHRAVCAGHGGERQERLDAEGGGHRRRHHRAAGPAGQPEADDGGEKPPSPHPAARVAQGRLRALPGDRGGALPAGADIEAFETVFFELEEGFKKLLSIHPDRPAGTAPASDERNPEVREVTQRCEVLGLPPLDAHLEEYLAFRFAQTGKKAEEAFAPDAYAAIRARLSYTAPRRGARRRPPALLYPLRSTTSAPPRSTSPPACRWRRSMPTWCGRCEMAKILSFSFAAHFPFGWCLNSPACLSWGWSAWSCPKPSTAPSREGLQPLVEPLPHRGPDTHGLRHHF